MGPVAAGRPLRSMSPGLRLRLRPPPLLTRKGLPATTGLGFGTVATPTSCLSRRPSRTFQRREGCPLVVSKGGGGGRRPSPGDMETKGHPLPVPVVTAKRRFPFGEGAFVSAARPYFSFAALRNSSARSVFSQVQAVAVSDFFTTSPLTVSSQR